MLLLVPVTVANLSDDHFNLSRGWVSLKRVRYVEHACARRGLLPISPVVGPRRARFGFLYLGYNHRHSFEVLRFKIRCYATNFELMNNLSRRAI